MRKTHVYKPVGRKKSRAKKRKLTIFLCICIALALAAIVFLKMFELRHFTVEGGSRYSQEEIKRLLMTEPTDQVSLFFWLRLRLFGEGDIPFVEKVEATLTGRNSVEVTVYDKRITGCVEQMGSYLYFDREGTVVESAKQLLPDVPLVTGLKFSKIVLKERMVTAKEGIFDVILDLVRLIEKQELKVSQIAFDAEDAVTLYIDGNVVFLGKKEHYDEALAVVKSLIAASGNRKFKFDMTAYENGNNRITAQSIEPGPEPQEGEGDPIPVEPAKPLPDSSG